MKVLIKKANPLKNIKLSSRGFAYAYVSECYLKIDIFFVIV